MKIFFSILLTPLVSAIFLGQNSSENCYHSPPQFKTTSTDSSNSTEEEPNESAGKCAYNEDSSLSDFVYFYYIKRGYNDYQKLTDNQMTGQVNQSLPTYMIIHGWRAEVGDKTNGWMRVTGKKVLEYVDANVILVDYGSISYCNYLILAIKAIYQLGEYIADCIIEKWNLSPNRTEIIGHSIGAHISGIVGSNLNGSILEIVGLDPAGPGFDGQIIGITQNTLNSSCAQFVQALHTKPLILGTPRHLGDIDFFVNVFSIQQPGCSLGISGLSCSHSRAYELYYASMFPENKFIGKASPLSWQKDKSSQFGFFSDRSKKGSFYFDTTACFGYAK